MCHRIRADENNDDGQKAVKTLHVWLRRNHTQNSLHFISFIFDALSMACGRVSGNVSLSVMAERVLSAAWSPPSPQRSLTPSRSQSSCWFFDVETGPDKASHQMSSGWEIGFDAVPFTISWPSLWHMDGIYVSHTDGAFYTKKRTCCRRIQQIQCRQWNC